MLPLCHRGPYTMPLNPHQLILCYYGTSSIFCLKSNHTPSFPVMVVSVHFSVPHRPRLPPRVLCFELNLMNSLDVIGQRDRQHSFWFCNEHFLIWTDQLLHQMYFHVLLPKINRNLLNNLLLETSRCIWQYGVIKRTYIRLIVMLYNYIG